MNENSLSNNNGSQNEPNKSIIPSDLIDELRNGVKQVMEITPERARTYSKIVVNINWIPSVTITFTPKN